MRILKNLRYPLVGWVAGILTLLGLALLWTKIFPGIASDANYETAGAGLPLILLITLVIATPAAIIGGIVGSRLPREGGRTEQTLVAALIGALFAIPFGCASFWVFSGY